MSWQLVIIVHVILSAIMTLYARHVAVSVKHVFFGVGVLSYAAVAAAGWVYSLAVNHGAVVWPTQEVWPYLLVEGLFIPAAWLMQYRLIRYIGASNAVIATTCNTLMAALAGIFLLGDAATPTFVLGGVVIMLGAGVALRLRPDVVQREQASTVVKVGLVLGGAVLFGIGIAAEKIAVDAMGASGYLGFGWTLQAVGALVLFLLFGRGELTKLNWRLVQRGLQLGVLTSMAGALYVYAVSLGSLSHTIVAAGAKTALVMVLAAVLFREYNSWPWRLLAFGLTVVGLWLVLG